MLAAAVTTYYYRTVIGHSVPEELSGILECVIVIQIGDSGIAHDFRHLGIGVFVVQIIHALSHAVQYEMMGKALGGSHVLPVTGDGKCICQHLVHAAELLRYHLVHLPVSQVFCNVQGPITELQEHFLSLIDTCILPGITQTGEHLVNIVPWHPRTMKRSEIAFADFAPYLCSVRHTAHIAVAVGILTALQLRQHVFQPVVALLTA